MLSTVAPDASRLLAAMEHADVILVSLHVPDWPQRLHGRSGYLVPKPVQGRVTAASFGSQKWAHWRPPGGGQVLRVSLGRDGAPVDDLDDDGAVTAAVDEVSRHLGIDLQPTAVRVSRWPRAFPQYRPGHAEWRWRVDSSLPHGVHVTGASYWGIGVPACIAAASKVAAGLLTELQPRSRPRSA